jgi:hypothetical protein
MIEYLSGEKKYFFSWNELREQHHKMMLMHDDEFLKHIPDALHLACIILYIKEASCEVLSDTGLIHQLVHLITNPETESLHEIRDLFASQLELV